MNFRNQANFGSSFAATAETQSALIRSVFNWMALGLAATGVISMYIANNPPLVMSLLSGGRIWILFLLEFGLVMWLSARAMKMSVGAATASFLAYSALNGITLAPIFLAYTSESVASTFLVTAGVFGGMAIYGQTTKRDLTTFRSFLMMGLFGILLAAIVNIFVGSSALSFAISVAGVLVFTGLTAYDVQKIRALSTQVREGEDNFRRLAILGALTLYLDFINLFLSLLRLMGRSRD